MSQTGAQRDAVIPKRAAVSDAIRQHLQAHPEVVCAFLHGSFLTAGPYRDIDVALLVDSLPGEGASRYTVDLAAELSLALGEPVDVRVLNGASAAFRYHVLSGQPLLVRDAERLDEFRARAWDEYFDFLPFSRTYLREVLGGIDTWPPSAGT